MYEPELWNKHDEWNGYVSHLFSRGKRNKRDRLNVRAWCARSRRVIHNTLALRQVGLSSRALSYIVPGGAEQIGNKQ